ncbi:MAG: LEA type 2 family protein [Bacteroidota bacterium]
MAIKKKHIIVGGIALLTLTGAALYWQYTKIMNYAIKLAGVKFKTFLLKKVDFDLSLNFTNNSDLTINIVSQDYKVFVNNVEILKVTNKTGTQLLKNTTSPINVNLQINPEQIATKLKASAINFLTNPEKVLIRFDIKLKVKLLVFTIGVPYVYETNLKELLAGMASKKEEPTATVKK